MKADRCSSDKTIYDAQAHDDGDLSATNKSGNFSRMFSHSSAREARRSHIAGRRFYDKRMSGSTIADIWGGAVTSDQRAERRRRDDKGTPRFMTVAAAPPLRDCGCGAACAE